MTLVPEVARRVDVPIVVGGIIPEADARALLENGVVAVYTPRDFDVHRIIAEMVELSAGPTTLADELHALVQACGSGPRSPP